MVISTSLVLGSLQAMLVVVFLTCTSTPNDETTGTINQYAIIRDIMVMLLLGFGFLMTFLHKYGLSAVGLTMVVTALAIQLNLLIEPFIKFLYNHSSVNFPLSLTMSSIIDAEFAAATALISFGVIIGRATPLQLLVMVFCQSIFYAINKVMIVFGALGAEDVGGTITIHAFGAYYGLAVSRAFLSPKPLSVANSKSTAISDVLSLLGTALLWVYWPSFVGGTETASPQNFNHCVLHTIFSLLGSTIATFIMSHHVGGKLNPFHIANATLAGGVAAGASARLDMTPGGAFVLGILAGIISVFGFAYTSPMLESKLSIYDTCGVHNLHGMPSLLGGLASAVFVALDSHADFLTHSPGRQSGHQVLAVVATVGFAIVSGWLTGLIMVSVDLGTQAEYDDAAWWKSEYLGEGTYPSADASHHSRGSILPITAGAGN